MIRSVSDDYSNALEETCKIEAARRNGDKVMMPADLRRLHKYMLDVEHIGIISDETRH
jgi:hypothetical protein